MASSNVESSKGILTNPVPKPTSELDGHAEGDSFNRKVGSQVASPRVDVARFIPAGRWRSRLTSGEGRTLSRLTISKPKVIVVDASRIFGSRDTFSFACCAA